ncbi:MAG TPA: winged helix-turn-helix domain-containing protein [Solirubrobacteraceae bacterium]|nr:winged helix-turn-helix domain-containing protein [Solirubrobacteraceae bacterium]
MYRLVSPGAQGGQLTGRCIALALQLANPRLRGRMASDPERVWTRHELLRDVWGYRSPGKTRTVDSHASRLRAKLAAAGAVGWVVTAWGVGYRLAP